VAVKVVQSIGLIITPRRESISISTPCLRMLRPLLRQRLLK
jgi:hypothetical protein